ncbi:MAG: hypothetical protein NVS1B6_11250 [Steroidobacteraceae bacterium]
MEACGAFNGGWGATLGAAPVGAVLGPESCCPPLVAQPLATIAISNAAQVSIFIVLSLKVK